MIAGLADTHAAVWFLLGDPRLSTVAKRFFDETAAARQKIAIAPISLAEMVYLIEKNRLPASSYDDLRAALSDPNHVLDEAPFTADVVESLRRVSPRGSTGYAGSNPCSYCLIPKCADHQL